jgi:hypothetical protein
LCPALIFFSFSSFFFLAHFVYLIIGCHPSALKIQNQLIIFAIRVLELSKIFIMDISASGMRFNLLLIINLKQEHHLFLQDLQGHQSVQITIIASAAPASANQLNQASKMNVFVQCFCSLSFPVLAIVY